MAPLAVRCVELVETVTDWMEGALDDDARQLVEDHLVTCSHCTEYVVQLRATSVVLAGSPDRARDAAPATARAALLGAFRMATGR